MDPKQIFDGLQKKGGVIECYMVREHHPGYTQGIWIAWHESETIYTTHLDSFVSMWKKRLKGLRAKEGRMRNNEIEGVPDSDEAGARALGILETKKAMEPTKEETAAKEKALEDNARSAQRAENIITWAEQLTLMYRNREFRLERLDEPRPAPDPAIRTQLGLNEEAPNAGPWRHAPFGYLPEVAGEKGAFPALEEEPVFPTVEPAINSANIQQSVTSASAAGIPGLEEQDKDTTIRVQNKKILALRKKASLSGRPTREQIESHIELKNCRHQSGKINYSKLSREYGIANHTVKKWCDEYKIK